MQQRTRPNALTDRVNDYITALAVERGLSRNTISAYRSDLAGYLEFLGEEPASPELVDGFLASLHEQGMRPATIARKLAAVRGFHRFLLAEGETDEDPTRFTETPRARMGFPKALDVHETIRLVETPPADTDLGLRDRAMLETLYGTAVRVSELVDLDLRGVGPRHPHGHGHREGEQAAPGSAGPACGGGGPGLPAGAARSVRLEGGSGGGVPERQRGAADPPGGLRNRAQARHRGGHTPDPHLTARAAPLGRHPHGRRGSGPSHRPRNPGSR